VLVRVNSGASGVAEYLETGRKRGREFDRDLIDERLVIDGDLVLMEAVINGIETAQEGDARYLHITLGLAERFTAADVCGPGEVNLAKLVAITEAYRTALMSAYDRREYAWYAEAHIPKVSHELHETTGEYVERLPHVHIVLPMRNLEDGRYLNPFGHGLSTIDYAQAMQEAVNAQFGLRSPLEAPRGRPHNAVAKHNPRFAPSTPKEIRETALALLREGRAATFEQLAERMAEFGEVKVRSGKDGDYLNVKPSWAEKGINLKDFGRLGFDATLERVSAAATVDAPGSDLARLAADWVQWGAYEARYLTSANRKHFKKLDEAAQRAWLLDKAAATRARLEEHDRLWSPESGVHAKFINALEEERNVRVHKPVPAFADARDAWRAAYLYQSGNLEAARRQPAQTLSGVRHLSRVPVVQRQGVPEMLLHPDASDRVGRGRTARTAVRRAGAGDRGAHGSGRKAITVAQTLAAARQRLELSPERLKADTSPSIVLATAARLYKLDVKQYAVTSGRDGTPRILHADRQYNLGDFFTKHLNVPWETAKPILVKCYHATLSDGLPAPDKVLWRSFTAWRGQAFEKRRAAAAAAKVAARARMVAARDEYKRAKLNSQTLPRHTRAATLAEARARRVVAEADHRRLVAEERAAVRAPSRNAEYREFLTELAGRGNLAALAELRRAAPHEPGPFDGFTGSKSKPAFALPSYKVDHTGTVTYFKDELSIVKDSAAGVAVVHRDQTAYETALKVAVARYGRALTLRGDKLFVEQMLAAARRSGLELTIRNADNPRAAPIHVKPHGPQR
jgi:hypothetical protein